MKVLMINGSTRKDGCTYIALKEIEKVLNEEGIETEIIQMGSTEIKDCAACGGCRKLGKCVYDDLANEIISKAETSDGFIFGTPVYYSHPTGQIQSLLDRVFYAGSRNLRYKPGAVIASARRAGNVISLDVLEKYLTINQMPVVSSSYWNVVFGATPSDVVQDLEGMQTMRNLGRNMAYLLKCIKAGKEQGILPPNSEQGNRTNFIR